jgi:hypothetical protein
VTLDELTKETPLFIKRRGVLLTPRGVLIKNILQAFGFLSMLVAFIILFIALFVGLHS